jgi:preprotein translocase subunit SecF
MKSIIRFSKGFLPAAIVSGALIVAGIVGYIIYGGFNLGVDFQAGLMQDVQIAPPAFSVTYDGPGNASISMSNSGLSIVITGTSVGAGQTYSFPYAQYPTMSALETGLKTISGVAVDSQAPGNIASLDLIQSAYGTPELGETPYRLHYLTGTEGEIDIAQVRSSFPESLGSVSVQVVGQPTDRHFMVRIDTRNVAEGTVPEAVVFDSLGKTFGEDNIVITSSNMVDSRFSESLTSQSGLLLFLTLLLILAYCSFRFRPQFAIGAVLAIMHDAFIMVGFIAWSRMEFNTTTIAAILTILGYSINDTIVIFDRVRETRRLYPDDSFLDVLNRAITETLSRTIITTVTTMLAVLSLFIFTTGSMKDFALALLVGMISGVYSTIFIACGFTQFWEKFVKGRKKSKAVKYTAKPALAKA